MPLRPIVFPLARGTFNRKFHTARILHEATHYETLQVPTNASPADIKKSFYTLSKTHHPDRNPNDPSASSRFVKISEAYHVLGTPSERQKYDREVLPRSIPTSPSRPSGSYSSSNPAGGRPASGLSKRRTHFRGPPPSFYRSGGWGAHSEKRSAAAEEMASNAKASTDHHNDHGPSAGYGNSRHAGGMGPGQTPLGTGDVRHLDREGHRITHENIQVSQEKRRRRKDETGPIDLPPGMLSTFIAVGGIISIGVFVPSLIFERLTRKPRKE